jgi:nucleoside-diphosphate-sugar epimerase
LHAAILRPRAFIPSWNRAVYPAFPAWAAWFARGAVHIDDVRDAVLCAVDGLISGKITSAAPAFVIDGAYDFTKADLAAWDAAGPGSSFRKYYSAADEALMRKYGLDPAARPRVLDVPEAEKLPGYAPRYSLRNMLEELKSYDAKAAAV